MSLSTVLTFGFKPAVGASSGQIVLMGYGTTGEAPPPQPPDVAPSFYGPALTPWERRRWFGDEDEDTRKKRQEEVLQAKRMEIGLIPKPGTPKPEKRVEKKIAKALEREPDPAVVARIAAKVRAELQAEFAQIRKEREAAKRKKLADETEMFDEEREAMQLLAILLNREE